MKQETYSEIRGTVRIHENVIATIVRKMACSVKGVSKISGSSFVDNIAEMVGSKKIQGRAISVEMNDSSVAVEVRVVLEYGVLVPEVAEEIKRAVAAEIVQLTGMSVARVNVVVMDLEDVQQDGI